MALRAAFIGVDRFADPTIRELSGCRRDALALWALFTDTVALEARLLLDGEATADAVRAALTETLGAAAPDDVVILSFSSHGTADHRLVVHDTDRARYEQTTIDMGELAAAFRDSKARAVLCILDCCFSGGAPARVLEDTPATRSNGLPLDALAGAGRILIAASNVNEPALEAGRHGLLTRSICEALQAQDPTVSVTAVVDDVMQRVRAEAMKMGHVQTPVMVGYVEGGLVLPALHRGRNFYAAFPEARGARVSAAIADLAAFGLPATVLSAWQEIFPTGLNALQLAAVNDGRILDGRSLLVVAPTSTGKTFVGEMAAAKAIADQRKAVFLFPYKALVNEKFDQFQRIYGDGLGMRVVRCTGDYLDQTSTFIKGKYDLAVLTYEMFLNLSVANPATVDLLGLVVVDEVQFIADPNRGIVIELLITNLLAARLRGIAPQIIALSAVIGGINAFDEWLGCEKLVRNRRPVPLVEGVIDRFGAFQYLDEEGKEHTEALLPRDAVVQRKPKPEKQDVIVPLVRLLLAKNANERIIIFRNKKGSAQGAARYLAQELRLSPATEALAALPATDPSTSLPVLRECLANGTAFHTTDLSREERIVVEREFRNGHGHAQVLVATTTVAAGINTPASTVIIPEQEFLGEKNKPYSVAEYKNMAGRAGRLGYQETGRSILLADSALERQQLFARYVLGKAGEIHSSFDPAHADTWLLRLLAQVRRMKRSDAVRLLASTFGGFLANRADPSWTSKTTTRLEALLEQMIDLRLVEVEEDGFVRLTLLGRACGNSSLSFRSAMSLVRTLGAYGSGLTAEQLMALLQALPELDEVYTPLAKRGQAESRWPQEVLRHFGRPVAQAMQQRVNDEFTFKARCKRAVVLRCWIAGIPMEQIERDATVNPFNGVGAGHVRTFADTTRFHLRSAANIASALLITGGPSEADLDALLTRLEVGLPGDLLDLLSLPVPLTRGEYLLLGRHGVKTAEQVRSMAEDQLEALLGPRATARFTSLRPA